MSVATKRRTIKIRVSDSEDARLRAAADRSQTTISDFVLRPALSQADEILSRPELIVLPTNQFDAMLAAMQQPVAPIEALRDLARRPRRFVRR